MTLPNIIVTIISVIVAGVIALQYKSLKEWMLWGVSEAEEYLGSGTGELKLQFVYDLAITRYPLLVKIIPFTVFKKLVDSALETMRELIAKNVNIANILTVPKE